MTAISESHWVVLKFGGTSVSSVSNWKNVAARRARAAGRRPAPGRRALGVVRHHRPPRATAVEGADRRMGTGDGADRAAPPRPLARSRHPHRRRTRTAFHRAAQDRLGHPPDRRGQRPAARARDGERRTDGDAHRRRVPGLRRHRRAVARRAHDAARGGAPRRHRAGELSLGDLQLRARHRRCSSGWRPAATC